MFQYGHAVGTSMLWPASTAARPPFGCSAEGIHEFGAPAGNVETCIATALISSNHSRVHGTRRRPFNGGVRKHSEFANVAMEIGSTASGMRTKLSLPAPVIASKACLEHLRGNSSTRNRPSKSTIGRDRRRHYHKPGDVEYGSRCW